MKENPTTDWSSVTVPADVIALFFGGVSTILVERFARESGMPKIGPGAYPLLQCVVWRLNRQKENRPATVEAARQRQLTAMAVKVEVANKVRAGELVEVAQVSTVLDQAMATLGMGLDALGPRLAGTLATMTDPAKIQETVLHETRAMRRTAADQLEAIGKAGTGQSDPPPATEPQRRGVGRRAPRPATRKPRAGTVAN